MKKWLFNPFVYLAGIKSLLIGLLIIAITSFLCTISSSHMDGVLDFHPKAMSGTFLLFLSENLIDLISITLILYLAGLIISKSSIRIIDVLGTQSVARFPYFFAPILGIMAPDPKKIMSLLQNKSAGSANPAISGSEIVRLIIFSVLSLALLVWLIVVMYNAYSVSCNVKKTKGIVSFAIGLLLAELLSKVLLQTTFSHFFK